MTRAIVILLLVAALASAARSFLPDGATVTGSGAALAFGFIILAAIQTGHIFSALKVPHLSGYLLCGVVFGPGLVGLLTPAMVHDLGLVKRVAVGLIALIAGCELNVRALRPRFATIGAYAALGLGTAAVGLFVLLLAILPHLDFTHGMTGNQRAVIALVATNVLVAASPSVVMGIISETRAAGVLSETCLALVVLADLPIVIAFAFSDTAVRSSFGDGGASSSVVGSLVWHIFGSLGIGAGAGAVLGLYVRRVGQRVGLFVFGVFFVLAETGNALHLDPLLMGLAAGLFLENVSPIGGHRVSTDIESVRMPTFAVFFAVIGAELDLQAFVHVVAFGAALAFVRAAGLHLGVRAAGRLLGADRALSRNVPFGMMPQAGVALALANLVRTNFAPWGPALSTLLIGAVVVNEAVAPILWRLALVRAGEVGRRGDAPPGGHARKDPTQSFEKEQVLPAGASAH